MQNVVTLADKRKSMGDREQFTATLDAIVIKPLGEDAPYGRYERRAPGEEYLVDLTRQGVCLFQNIVERIFNPRQIALDPVFEVCAPDRFCAPRVLAVRS